MSKFSRLKLTDSYHKITGKTPEERDVEGQEWFKDSEQVICHICDKRLEYRDIREYDDDFKVRAQCGNHSKLVHFSFSFPKTKKAWEALKAEQEQLEAEEIAKKKAKADAQKKADKKKSVKTKKAKVEPEIEPLPEGVEEGTITAELYRNICPDCKTKTVEETDTSVNEEGEDVSIMTCSKCESSWEF